MCRRQLKRSDLTEGKSLNPPELQPEAAMANLFMAESKLEVLLREARPAVAPSRFQRLGLILGFRVGMSGRGQPVHGRVQAGGAAARDAPGSRPALPWGFDVRA